LMISQKIRDGRTGGAEEAIWIDESLSPLEPRNIYGVTKRAAEEMCRLFNHLHGLRSEEHTSELQSLAYLVCRLLLEKKNAWTQTGMNDSIKETISHPSSEVTQLIFVDYSYAYHTSFKQTYPTL